MAGAAVKRARAGGGSIRDRLSALPDELLLRVLSFLPAQQVVRTTVLSKRWKDLWRSVPGINLSFLDFRSNLEEDWSAVWERMDDFVNNLLMLHRAPCLDAFRLVSVVDFGRHVDRWVRRAIKDDPLVIEISLAAFSSHQLPYLSSSPCRRLRSLHLNGVSLDHSFAERLHSWWPELKDLTLRNCRTVFCGIESDKLENLVVRYCIDQPADVFAIKAPHLASLSVQLGVPFSLDAGNSLVRASISLNHGEFSPRSGAMLLGSLFNVTSFKWEYFQATVHLLYLKPCFAPLISVQYHLKLSPYWTKTIDHLFNWLLFLYFRQF